MFIKIIIILLNALLILLTVAFFTLFERKVIGRFHQRLGPNKVRILGLLQPILDALKLFLKNKLYPNYSNKYYYTFIPMIALFLSSVIFIILPNIYKAILTNNSLLIFLLISSLRVFIILFRGWASNSKYTLLGSLRRIAQSISYETVFNTILLLFICLFNTYSIEYLNRIKISFISILLFPIWLLSFLAETHRAPFDFSEAESELVSGFNTEFSGAAFAFLFLSEYIIIILGSILIFIIFFNFLKCDNLIYLSTGTLFLTYLIIWIRITFCRFRYDYLMRIAWKSLLPIRLSLFLFVFWNF